MEAQLILDVLGEDGRIVSRHRVGNFPVRVGRGIEDDIYLEDEHVCKSHFEICRDESGTLTVKNLSEINGLREWKKKNKFDLLPVAGGCRFIAGETTIRITPIPVETTAAKRISRHRKDSHWIMVAFLLLVCLGVSVTISTLLTYTNDENPYSSALFTSLMSIVLIALIWGGSWSFFGRMMVHRFRFSSHLVLTLGAYLFSMLAFSLIDYFRFATASPRAAYWLQWWLVASVLAILIGRHLRLSTTLSNSARTIYSLAIVAVFCGISGLYHFSKNLRYSNATAAIQSVKPTYFRLTRAENLEGILSDMDNLNAAVRQDLEEEVKN